jgi:hypothetical protein
MDRFAPGAGLRPRCILAALAALVLLACSQTSSTRARWHTLDGRPADSAALRAASSLCRERVQVATRAGPGENVEWGLAMVDCLRGEGFVLVTDDPELAR